MVTGVVGILQWFFKYKYLPKNDEYNFSEDFLQIIFFHKFDFLLITKQKLKKLVLKLDVGDLVVLHLSDVHVLLRKKSNIFLKKTVVYGAMRRFVG